MKSINGIFSNDINNIMNSENYTVDNSPPGKKSHVHFKLLNNATSMHDLCKNPSNAYYNKFIQKYHRKYNRFFDNIKGNETLYFIRCGDITKEEVDIFINSVYKVNPKCNFFLIYLTPDHPDNQENEFITINLKKYEKTNNYSGEYYNIKWNVLFDYILTIK